MPLIIKLHPPPTQPPIHLPTPKTSPPSANPATLNDALTVRYRVFVEEQGCAAENEVDENEGGSWHWVAYALPEGSAHGENGDGDGGEDRRDWNGEAIGVIRLVPPTGTTTAHRPDNANTDATADPTTSASGNAEPHIKLTRLAVLPPHRGHHIAHHLVQTALTWAAHNAGPINGNGAVPGRVDQTQTQTQTSTGPVVGWSGLVLVHAQVAVEGMYQRLGFVRDEEMGKWQEEGIEHVGMWRRVQVCT